MNSEALFSRGKDDWCTPRWLFEALNAKYNFVLDAAASEENHLCERYFSENFSAFTNPWPTVGNVFCNPPYSKNAAFLKRAYEESKFMSGSSLFLVPARTDTRWWHEIVLAHAATIAYIKGRLDFTDPNGEVSGPAPFPSAIVKFDYSHAGPPKHVAILQPKHYP